MCARHPYLIISHSQAMPRDSRAVKKKDCWCPHDSDTVHSYICKCRYRRYRKTSPCSHCHSFSFRIFVQDRQASSGSSKSESKVNRQKHSNPHSEIFRAPNCRVAETCSSWYSAIEKQFVMACQGFRLRTNSRSNPFVPAGKVNKKAFDNSEAPIACVTKNDKDVLKMY